MADKINNISFRLSDENHEKLENMANSYDLQKSTMAANIIANVLNENLHELMINHISYPRPVTKKLFTMLTTQQLQRAILDLNEYNKGIIESAKSLYSEIQIFEKIKKWFKNSGCEVSMSSSECKKFLEVHHEMERNWSVVTCASITFILELLGNKIEKTFVDENWFKIEYSYCNS